MTIHPIAFLEPAALAARPLKISPTDVSQFIRLDQCERYLRLRLHERAQGQKFLYDYGVAPQSIPPILTQSGAEFEDVIEAAIGAAANTTSCKGTAVPGTRTNDNTLVVERARALAPGGVAFLFQPRLEVDLDGWFVRGDVDILRFERDAAGDLRVIIADMKSSTSAKLEHRLQVGFYHEMLDRIFNLAGLPCAEIRTAILYRGPEDQGSPAQRAGAQELFHTDSALLELVPHPENYRDSVRDLVTGTASVASRVASVPFDELTFHLSFKCDGCLYNAFCMKWSAERDDLSMLSHLHENDKKALHKHGVTTITALATLKDFATPTSAELVTVPRQEVLVRQLSTAWPLGPRLDEVIHRARRYRHWKKDDIRALSYMPSKGYGSLPYCAPDHNPNLVKIYIDAQFDYLHDRAYMFGALLVGHENGVPVQRRSVVKITSGPPETPEREQHLLIEWVNAVIAALVEVAAPDAEGHLRAPVHLIFFNALEQQIVLDALARHFGAVLGATPLYDFMTQIAAFDSSLLTYLDSEIRELKNYPMVCQSLQAVASHLRFDWNVGENYREIFYRRLFDDRGRLEGDGDETEWYTSRARFSSHIPLEYAYASWDALPPTGRNDDFADYRGATVERLTGFHARRLEALEHIANDFRGNRQTVKTAFALPDLASFSGVARTLAQALAEFVTIERHVELAAWKSARLAPPERRVLAGTTFIVRYCADDQPAELLTALAENEERRALKEQFRAAYFAAKPQAKKFMATKEQKAATALIELPAPFRLRLELAEVECDLDQALLLTTIRPGARMVMATRWDVDSRLPADEQVPYTPTPKQLLYAARADVANIDVERDHAGKATTAFVEVRISDFAAHVKDEYRSFVFGGRSITPQDGVVYTLDDDPNSWYAYWCAVMVDAVRAGGANTLYQRLEDPTQTRITWPAAAADGQARFLAGIDALHTAGAMGAPAFDTEVRRYIGENGGTSTLLVQGPPGTGKSYTSAFALFARVQGALAAGIDRRVFLSCKTHAATDVLLTKIVELQQQLRRWRSLHPTIFDHFIDLRLLDLPLFRVAPREGVPGEVVPLRRKSERQVGDAKALQAVLAERWCIVATTPGGTYGMLKDADEELTGHNICQCLVLDEASQMNLPEALLAAAPLAPDGQLIVVGDDRQMPPIIKHDWATERRRTFQQYRAYESLFSTLRAQNPVMIKFAESFRLHATMAAFLRREIYEQDGIAYFSRRTHGLAALPLIDPFVASVLHPDYPLVVIVHDEAASQQQNLFEQQLMMPILAVLTDPEIYGLDAINGLGVVVPHRAQRAALQDAIPALTVRDPATGLITVSAVDTVERFQGGERTVVLVSATESDRDYLRATGDFLLDPRRLNVALSRAKCKIVLVASRSVFTVFSPDEDTFANAQIWKNLLRRTCTTQLWQGKSEGVNVEVWGNSADI